jgi:hypothetical protein
MRKEGVTGDVLRGSIGVVKEARKEVRKAKPGPKL